MELFEEMIANKEIWKHLGPCPIEECGEAYLEYTAKDPKCTYFLKIHFIDDGKGIFLAELTSDEDGKGYDPNCENKGYATECLKWLQEYAGFYGVYLELWPGAYDRASGGKQIKQRPDTSNLIRWYQSLGFEFSPNGNTMVYN